MQVEKTVLSRTGAATTSLASLAEQRELANKRISLEQRRAGSEQARLAAQIASLGPHLAEVDRQNGLKDELTAYTPNSVAQAETPITSGFAPQSDLSGRQAGVVAVPEGPVRFAISRACVLG